jgi:hypothetical protein
LRLGKSFASGLGGRSGGLRRPDEVEDAVDGRVAACSAEIGRPRLTWLEELDLLWVELLAAARGQFRASRCSSGNRRWILLSIVTALDAVIGGEDSSSRRVSWLVEPMLLL